MSHPFLDDAFHVRWSTLAPDVVEPDITEALARADRALRTIISQDREQLTFNSVILAYEDVLRELHERWALVRHLDALCNSPALRGAYNKMLPTVSAFFAKIPLNPHLWDLVQTYSQTDEAHALTGTKKRALEESVAYFRQHGADLPADKKKRLEEIDAELSQATQKYSENLLDSTNAWELVIDDASTLTGLPTSAIDAAREDAEAKGLGTPDAPCEKAQLLGKDNFADHILERRRTSSYCLASSWKTSAGNARASTSSRGITRRARVFPMCCSGR